jgi:hypothetical protein
MIDLAELYEKQLGELEKQRQKVKLTKDLYSSALEYLIENVEEDNLHVMFNSLGEPQVFVTTGDLPEAHRLVGEVVRILKVEIVGRPDSDSVDKRWMFAPRDRGPDTPWFWLICSPKSCRRVKVGEETVTKPVYEIVCDDSDSTVEGLAGAEE